MSTLSCETLKVETTKQAIHAVLIPGHYL